MNKFIEQLLIFIFLNIRNDYKDNYDYYRFGLKPEKRLTLKQKIKQKIIKLINGKFINLNIKKINDLDVETYIQSVYILLPYYKGFYDLYNKLKNQESQDLLIRLLVYRILGANKVKLPLNTSKYWEGIIKIKKLENINDYLEVPFVGDKNLRLNKYDLSKINIPIEIYSWAGLYTYSDLGQYFYKKGDVIIKPQLNDIVLDCGACWGDTTLYFAHKVGKAGHVYSFEFLPANIDVFNKNIKLNKNLSERITLVQNPLSSISDQKVSYYENGPGSSIKQDFINDSSSAKTVTIDDFISKKQVEVDFIKMDIEGSEMDALKGAEKTIRKFKPKLAISIYHSLDDFVNIPKWITELNLGYMLYLEHYTIHNEETVIYAKV